MIESIKKYRGKVFLFINYCYILIGCSQLGLYLSAVYEKSNAAPGTPDPVTPGLMGSFLALIFPWIFLLSAHNQNRNEPGAIDEKSMRRLKATSVICSIASGLSILTYLYYQTL